MKINRKVFNQIYRRRRWIWGSGTGSIPVFNRPFIQFVNHFLADHPDINIVIDVGCGDHQIGKKIYLKDKIYIGCDVSDRILEKTNQKFSSPNKKFLCLDAASDQLPSGDLIILKDVLQHLSNKDVSIVLSRTADYKYAIIQNDLYDENSYLLKRRENKDIPSGKVRPLNINEKPFNADYKLALRYTEGLRYLPNMFRRLLLLAPIQKGIFIRGFENKKEK